MSKNHGRPTDCNTESIQKIAQDIRNGLPRESAARINGISKKTFYNWIDKGRLDIEPYVRFLYAIEVAEHELEQELVTAWISCSTDKVYILDGKEVVRKGDWKAAETFLKRRKPKDYSEQTFINLKLENEAYLSELEKLAKLSEEIIVQMSAGKVSAEVAATVLKALEERRHVIQTVDQAEDIEEIQNKLKGLGH